MRWFVRADREENRRPAGLRLTAGEREGWRSPSGPHLAYSINAKEIGSEIAHLNTISGEGSAGSSGADVSILGSAFGLVNSDFSDYLKAGRLSDAVEMLANANTAGKAPSTLRRHPSTRRPKRPFIGSGKAACLPSCKRCKVSASLQPRHQMTPYNTPAGFASLPPEGLVDAAIAGAFLGLTAECVGRGARSGALPAPRRMGRLLRWSVADLRAVADGSWKPADGGTQ